MLFQSKSVLKILAGLVVVSSGVAQAIEHPENVVGPEKCLECHKSEGKTWQKTHHFNTFNEMHKSKDAKAIADKMGVKQIKKEATCLQCHYTADSGGEAVAGISCESCHGAAKSWIKVHNDYGGKDVKKEQEPAAHKEQRISQSVSVGMIRPDDIYSVAQNCFQCHTVPNEKLVEVGGHNAGSDFELVSWSQGEVRHNFLNGGANRPASPERKRVMYIAGRVLDLEYGLRGVAKVTKKSTYAVAMAKRAKKALGYVEQIKGAVKDPALDKIFAAGSAAELKPNNEAALLAAADTISKTAREFLKGKTGAEWAAVDSMIPSQTKGKSSP